MQQGSASVQESAEYLLFTDADIVHASDNLRRLVARASKSRLTLVSVMVKLRCESWLERAVMPAFVFFFEMLFPFAWVNRPRNRVAAAAGGCMLVRRSALDAAGGIAAIRDKIIDDCALAGRLKRQGPVWLGLSEHALSLRPYRHFGDVRGMITRSAYAQLGYSPYLLAATIVMMVLAFWAPPVVAVLGSGDVRLAALAAWSAMALALAPMLRFYRLSPLWGLAFPAIATVYMIFTIDSAVQHWRGRGGMWKGRAQAAR
jgi:hopene-associated glycosyltransferase HpnB